MSGRAPARVVVVGYDGSTAARTAVDNAAARAGRRGRVLLVRALGRGPDPGGERRAHAQAELDGVLLMGNDALLDTEWETTLAEAPAAEAILQLAAERDADEIVVGSHGRGASAAVLGSVSQELIRRSDRPVTVIGPHAVKA